MKKSRVFMVAGAMILAVIGVTASKAKNFATTYYYWDASLPSNNCISLGTVNPCANLGTQHDCIYNDGSTTFPTYYTTGTTACQTPLKYNQ